MPTGGWGASGWGSSPWGSTSVGAPTPSAGPTFVPVGGWGAGGWGSAGWGGVGPGGGGAPIGLPNAGGWGYGAWGVGPWGSEAAGTITNGGFEDDGTCGQALHWQTVVVATVEQWAGWDNGRGCVVSVDRFDGGWFNNETYRFAFLSGDLLSASWNYDPTDVVAPIGPIVNTLVNTVDRFNQGWPSPPRDSSLVAIWGEGAFPYPGGVVSGNERYAFTFDDVSSVPLTFNHDPGDVVGPFGDIPGCTETTRERFNQGWPSPHRDASLVSLYGEGTFPYGSGVTAGNEVYILDFASGGNPSLLTAALWNNPDNDAVERFNKKWNNDTYVTDFTSGGNPALLSAALWNGVSIRSTFFLSTSDVWAVGEKGAILHFDGTTWSSFSSGVSVTLTGVWAASATDVWAVGLNGTVLHYDGDAWSVMDIGGRANSLYAVTGSDSAHVWIVGSTGLVLFWNGASFAVQASGTSLALFSIALISNSDIMAVGSNGISIHFNGTIWNTVATGTTATLNSVCTAPSTLYFAVGSNGTVLNFNGSAWFVQASGTTVTLFGVCAETFSNALAVGAQGKILHFNGSAWSVLVAGSVSTPAWRSIFLRTASQVWLVGDRGQSSFYNGTTFTGQDAHSVARPVELFDLLWQDQLVDLG